MDKIICGDAIQVLKTIDSQSIDALITDPPYNIGYKYDNYNDRMNKNDYFDWQIDILTEAVRILKPEGSILWLNYPEIAAEFWYLAPKNIPELIPFEWITWIYHPHTGGNPLRKASRAWLWFTISKKPYIDKKSMDTKYRNPTDKRIIRKIERGDTPLPLDWIEIEQVKNITKEKTEHPTQIPERMSDKLVKLVCPEGGIVVDPFIGSGTVAVSCAKSNRHYIGIDQSEKYCEIARNRIQKTIQNIENTLFEA